VTRNAEMLEAIRIRKAELRKELQEIELMEAQLLNEVSGVKPGDRVRRTFGAMKGAVFVVSEVHHVKHTDKVKPWVSGYMIKKDGEPGCALKHLYHEWEKIEDGVRSER
jgi:hypothetical protein